MVCCQSSFRKKTTFFWMSLHLAMRKPKSIADKVVSICVQTNGRILKCRYSFSGRQRLISVSEGRKRVEKCMLHPFFVRQSTAKPTSQSRQTPSQHRQTRIRKANANKTTGCKSGETKSKPTKHHCKKSSEKSPFFVCQQPFAHAKILPLTQQRATLDGTQKKLVMSPSKGYG